MHTIQTLDREMIAQLREKPAWVVRKSTWSTQDSACASRK